MAKYDGRLELTWTNKHECLLARDDGTYEWLPASDYRVAEVRLLDNVASVGTVSRCRADDNLLIQGDALHVLESLSRLPEFKATLVGQVQLAYIDPPFNTQQAFPQYDDALEHSVWLTMIRDRLVQIKNMLAPNGSVWLHLDDAEAHRARCVMDEVFGSANFMGSVIWRSSDNSNNHATTFSTDHNTLIVYAKDTDWESKLQPARPEQVTHFTNPDNDPDGPWFDGNPVNNPAVRPNLQYSLSTPNGNEIPSPPNGWRWSRETMQSKIESGEIRFTDDETSIRRRTYLKDHAGLPPSSLWADLAETGHNRQAKSELKRLFPGVPTSGLFATPKPERLLRRIIQTATDPGDLVLDCFVGSGTTVAVAHKLGRRWIGVDWSSTTIDTYAVPRLRQVVDGTDKGGVTALVNWPGGGGFRVLRAASSMFEAQEGLVFLAQQLTNGALAEATAAQLGFEYANQPPFAGTKGRSRLAVVDGVVNEDVVRLLITALTEDERIVICGTGIDPEARRVVRGLRPGSTVRKIPAALLDRYRSSNRTERRRSNK